MGDKFNGIIYFMIRGCNMVAKQEVASITTYIYASRLIFSIYRFEWVTSSMAPFILYFGESIWPPNRQCHRLQLILMQVNYSFVYVGFDM